MILQFEKPPMTGNSTFFKLFLILGRVTFINVTVEQRANEVIQSKQLNLLLRGFCYMNEVFFMLLYVNITIWRRHVNSVRTHKNRKVYSNVSFLVSSVFFPDHINYSPITSVNFFSHGDAM